MNEIARERAQSFLRPEHQSRILACYEKFASEPGFARVATLQDVAAQNFSLSIPLYVKRTQADTDEQDQRSLVELYSDWQSSGQEFWKEMDGLVETLDELVKIEVDRG